MAKKFMFVCAGLLMLSGAYHLGAQNTVAQSADSKIVEAEIYWMNDNNFNVVSLTDLGDVYIGKYAPVQFPPNGFIYVDNVFSSAGVVGSDASSLNDLKSMFR